MKLSKKRTKSERQKIYSQTLYKKLCDLIFDDYKVNFIKMEYTPLKRFPDKIKFVNGLLDLSSTEIKKLPDNLTVLSYLSISNTPIKKLPSNLKVGKSLYIYNTLIEELPKDLVVGGSVFISNTPLNKKYDLDELNEMYPTIRGKFISWGRHVNPINNKLYDFK